MYFVIPKKGKSFWLLLASYYFYMSWNPKYIVLILFSTVITYLSGILLGRAEERTFISARARMRQKKWIVFLCCAANLGLLGFFKYFDFLLKNLNYVSEKVTGITFSNPFDFVLPVGISFYTFQALGYMIDVYRREIPAEKNFIRYALFVSFFPQLVAGPIERSGNLLKDIQEIPDKKMWDYERITSGLITMVWGMFLKLVITDRISAVTDAVFSGNEGFNSLALWLGAIAFSLQIYCDFSGYSTIAIGAARVMGFHLMENFNTPYFSRSIKEFWRRWHISLSTWFRDYLYIPLGGNRCSRIRRYLNLMITFLVSGFWHGAGWTFIIWGGVHGAYQIVGEALMPVRRGIGKAFRINNMVSDSSFP